MDPYSAGQFNHHYHQQPPMMPPKTNGKAITALVLGILAFTPYVGFILGIMAIIFAALSFKELKRRPEQGRGLAIAGMVCGIVACAFYFIFFVLVVLLFGYFAATDSSYYYDVMSYMPKRFFS